jgi:CubicO group peptidase (beta-lactamase class C family)
MVFEQERDLAERINRIEHGLFKATRIIEQREQKASLLDLMEDYGVPGVSVAVIHQGRIEWARGYGVQDIETREPVTPDTRFQAASISKPVSASAVLRLVEAGQLDLDEDVNAYLRSWKVPQNGSWQPRVTLRLLLCHGAGMTVHGFPGYPRDAEVPTLVQVLEGGQHANTDPIRVDTLPGTQFRYSGGGYCIVQQILMDVTGQPFPQLMRELVLDPLGMQQSTFEQPLPHTLAPVAATAYRPGARAVFGKWHIYPEMAAAGLWTTPSDLARFALALQSAWAGRSTDFLSQETVRSMLTPQVESFTGLGPRLDGQGNSARFSHSGGNEGFRCFLEAYVQGDIGAAIMTNADEGFSVIERVMPALAQEYHWPDYLPAEGAAFSKEPVNTDAYVGEYELKSGLTFTITRQEDQLFLQPTGQSALALYPESDTTYVFHEINAEVVFVKEDDQKEVTELIFKQNDREMKGKKLKL